MAFKLDGYVEVKDRIPEFWEKYPDGCIVNSDPEVVEIAGRTFIKVTTETYRSSNLDERPMTRSTSMEPFPGTTNFTKDSEAENAETSAMGRALGARGIGIKHGFASADEVRNRQSADDAEPTVTTKQASDEFNAVLAKEFAPADLAEVGRKVWESVNPRIVGHGRIPQSELDRLLAAATDAVHHGMADRAEAPNQ